MKKTFVFSLLAAVVAAAGCRQAETASVSTTRTVTFIASAEPTRTQFGDKQGEVYPTLWTADHDIHVSLNGNTEPVNAAVTPSEDGRYATFTSEIKDPVTGMLRYYAVSPAECCDGFYPYYGNEYDFIIPAEQTPTASSCDPLAQILLGISDEVDLAVDSVVARFSHLTAYGKFSLLNLGSEAGAVQSVVLSTGSTGAPLTGIYELHWMELPATTEVYEPKREVTVNTSSTEDIWFGCYPADLSGGKLDVTVRCENGKYTKSIDLTGKTLAFKAGTVSEFKIDMAGAQFEGSVKAEGNFFTFDGEVYPCVSAVLSTYSSSVEVHIGDIEGATSGSQYTKRLCLTIEPENMNGEVFTLRNSQVEIYNPSYQYFYNCEGTASVYLKDGILKLTLDGLDSWSYSSTHSFTASYEGPVYDAR